MEIKPKLRIILTREEKQALFLVALMLKDIDYYIDKSNHQCDIQNDEINEDYNILGALDEIKYYSTNINKYINGDI